MYGNFFKKLFNSNASSGAAASHSTHAHYRRPHLEELTPRVAPATGLLNGALSLASDAAVHQIVVDNNAMAHMNADAGLAHAGITATGVDHAAASAANATAGYGASAAMDAGAINAQATGNVNANAAGYNVQGSADANASAGAAQGAASFDFHVGLS